MKKTLFIALLASFAVNAQIREKGEIEIAPFIGFSSSGYYGNTDVSYEPTYNVHFGISSDIFLNEKWSVRTGLEYQTMGTDGTVNLYVGRQEFKEKLNYVAVPLHANVHLGKKRNWNINFGPTVAFLVSATSEGKDVDEFIKPTHIAIGGGLGYKFHISTNFDVLLNYQQQFGVTSNFKYGDFLSSSFGGLNVKAVFKLGSRAEKEN